MLKHTPLHKEHLLLGARMGPFAEWDMPIQYSGIINEHLHTRSKAGLFDICHMGEFIIKGETAAKDVAHLLTCRTDSMYIGRCRYGFMLNEAGGIIDDLIIFKTKENEFMLVVNAGTAEKDKEWIRPHLSPNTLFEDTSGKVAKIDLQGPESLNILKSYSNALLEEIKKYHFITGSVCDVKALISMTGYTGELGYELYCSTEEAKKIWNKLLENTDVKPIGLGARDTLRLEMGYSLYGQDIDENHTPLEAGLEKFVYMEKDFIGKEALIKQKTDGIKNVLVGFVADGRRSPRHDFDALYNNKPVGKVTSASFSPCLKKGIGLCYINQNVAAEGVQIKLTDNKVSIEAIVTKPPFIKKG